jgi:dihydrofolate synthase/folylpolyglutamate synthase
VARLDHPERAFQSVHVAGTNGKGSVTAMVDAALRAAGHRTARYTSPHLIDVSERFVIDGRAVDRAAVIAAVADVRDVVESLRAERALDVQPTFFEVTTAVAFELFRRAGVSIAVLEVGLGGRLDATNVVRPIASAITSIAFDHEKYLGNTIRAIAIEKAGIIKPGVPVVVGPVPVEAALAIDEIAGSRGAAVVRAAPDDVAAFQIGLAGAHQRANAAVAVALLRLIDQSGFRVPETAIVEGLARPDWPGRLETRRLADGREALLDAAHNPAGATALASYLAADQHGPRPLVFAAMRDKALADMLAILLPHVSAVIFTRASNPRSADPEALAAAARRVAAAVPIAIEQRVEDAIARAWQMSPRIVVAGSIFLLGDVVGAIRGS